MDSARHVIKHMSNPRCLSQMSSYDVASTVHQSLDLGDSWYHLITVVDVTPPGQAKGGVELVGRGLHSSAFGLIVSTFCGTRWVS